MPALGFQKRFEMAVENGLDLIAGCKLRNPGVEPKTQTIRALRKDKREPKIGEMLQFYSGWRTKSCRKLGEAPCTSWCLIRIEKDGIAFLGPVEIWIAKDNGADKVAAKDGFSNFDQMRRWFDTTHKLPFYGHLIRWME